MPGEFDSDHRSSATSPSRVLKLNHGGKKHQSCRTNFPPIQLPFTSPIRFQSSIKSRNDGSTGAEGEGDAGTADGSGGEGRSSKNGKTAMALMSKVLTCLCLLCPASPVGHAARPYTTHYSSLPKSKLVTDHRDGITLLPPGHRTGCQLRSPQETIEREMR